MRYTTDEIRLKNMVTEGLKQKPFVKFGDVTLVRIPKIKGRTRALEPNKQGTYNIEYIHERWYDPEIRQCRNRKVVIGFRRTEFTGQGRQIPFWYSERL